MPYGNYEAVEALAHRFKEESFIHQKSLITGATIWTTTYFDELYQAYNMHLEEFQGSFDRNINFYLRDVSSQARQLFAELYILDMLPLGNIGLDRKLENINRILKDCDPQVHLTDEIVETLEAGVFNGGQGYNIYRSGHFAYAIQLGQALSQLSFEERRHSLSSPDAVEDTVYSLVQHPDGQGYRGFQKALCYLLAPEYFEPIISERHLDKITSHFSDFLEEDEKSLSPQRQATVIRKRVAEQRKVPDWHFYVDEEEWFSPAQPALEDTEKGENLEDTAPPEESGQLLFPPEATDSLLVPSTWLEQFLRALGTRRQVILQGPPGTGKTYLARRIARILAGSETRVKLVQFHPAYTYEDFFEGFRPVLDRTNGNTSLQLKRGPLRQLAEEAAENPSRNYFLIIDEINRGNLARIFGELYFLLEYRDQAVDLMYSQDQFYLPQNLYIIGTMNTADRSIALVDSAMRRRFAFFNMHPDQEPTANLLKRWAAKNQLEGPAIEAWEKLNQLIPQIDLKVGPSYFMRLEAFTDRGLRDIWEAEIIPLLEEHFYGQADIASRYSLDQVLANQAG